MTADGDLRGAARARAGAAARLRALGCLPRVRCGAARRAAHRAARDRLVSGGRARRRLLRAHRRRVGAVPRPARRPARHAAAGCRSCPPGAPSSLLVLDAVALASGRRGRSSLIACVAGITAPPLVASARSLWTRAVDASLVRRGYAITSLISDVGQVGGPVLAGLLFALAAWSPLLICAVGTITAAALIVTGPDAPATHAQPQPMPKLRESRGFVGLLIVSILFGAALGLVQVGVPTLAGRWEVRLGRRPAARRVRARQRRGRALVRRPQLAPARARALPDRGARLRRAARAGRARDRRGDARAAARRRRARGRAGRRLDVREPRRARARRRRRGVHVGDDRRGRPAGRSAPRSRACS